MDYSQYNEEELIAQIFKHIGTTSKFAIEFGAENGYLYSNTRKLKDEGWDVLMMDADNKGNDEVKKEFITAENINALFDKYDVPDEVDFLSMDTDGNDYWIWKAIERKPRVVCIEYNPFFPESLAMVMQYNPKHVWDDTNYYGASFKALTMLAQSKGYRTIHLTDANIFFLRDEIGYPQYEIRYERRDVHAPANPETSPYIYLT